MSREKIGVDIDDVIADHLSAFIDFSNKNYGTNLLPEDYTDEWSELWGVEWDELMNRARDFHASNITHLEPISEAHQVLSKLAVRYDLVVVTARPSHATELTHQWLDQHFKGIFRETHFVPVWEETSTVTKAEICKQIGVDYLIDDVPKHCNLAANAGITSLLFGDHKWVGSEYVDPEVVRVKNWHQVGEYFNV